ncbi:hypothetical protein D6810_01250 [Candidatus Dojkabacteria bacterium]|uniref:Uncharacterized protein n=1 Tax=Candidatus Dojkabacteria bacterium TaxID=2099670 RepID=A0A3M0Z0N7_9BACT|nr:MAG: hypothetical protein D6810_01250 [Candidatus Dojkabacteria bacterium]
MDNNSENEQQSLSPQQNFELNFNDSKSKSLVSEKKSLLFKKALLGATAVFLLFFGVFVLFKITVSLQPNKNINSNGKVEKNVPSSRFQEQVPPLSFSTISFDIGNLKLYRDFSDEYKYLLATSYGQSSIYKASATSVETYFSSGREIVSTEIYPQKLIVYVVKLDKFNQLWIKDLTGQSLLIYTSKENEQIISSQLDFEIQGVYFLTFSDQVVRLKLATSNLDTSEIAILGNLSNRARIVDLDRKILKIKDGRTCYTLALSILRTVETDCESLPLNHIDTMYKVSPNFSNFFSSNDGSSVDRYNKDIKSYVRIYNAPKFQILTINQGFRNSLLLNRYQLSLNTQTNKYTPSWKSFSILKDGVLTDLVTSLPNGNITTQNLFTFLVGSRLYLIDTALAKAYYYETNNPPVSNPISGPVSNPISYNISLNPGWNAVNLINNLQFESITLVDAVYSVL